MSKRFTKLIAAFAATMTMLPASAQVMPENQVPLIPAQGNFPVDAAALA